MSKRTLVKASIALLIVLVASLSTVRARQAWGEQQAHSSFVAAQRDSVSALSRARALGLLPGELAQLRLEKQRLDRIHAPSSSILWGSEEAFYNHRAAAYRILNARIDSQVVAVRALTSKQASAALATLSSTISRAKTYGLDVTRASNLLVSQQRASQASQSPREYRKIVAAVKPVIAHVRSSISTRSAMVSQIESSGGNTAAGVQQLADSDVASTQGSVSLISLFSRTGKQLSDRVTALDSAIHAQSATFDAAVKEATLRDVIASVDGLMAKVVPSKVVLVSTEDQWAHMYENGKEVYNTPVTTGGPELPTDHGTFHIYAKFSPFEFHSPWPIGSPYYYPPTPVQFWMPFDGGIGLHDASWRSNFGPGSNVSPTDLGTGTYILGTHGCVNLPYDAAAFVWDWAPIGTTVVVV